MNLLKIKRLDAKGLSHHVLVAILVITGIAGFGAWRVFSSSAATNYAGMCGEGFSRFAEKNFTYGKLLIFKKGTGAGTDYCAFTVRTGGAKGVAGQTYVELGDSINNVRHKHYAGPVKVFNDETTTASAAVSYGSTRHTTGIYVSPELDN